MASMIAIISCQIRAISGVISTTDFALAVKQGLGQGIMRRLMAGPAHVSVLPFYV
jgi:hypothetical protein